MILQYHFWTYNPKHTRTTMFIAALGCKCSLQLLSTIAKTWNQPKCPLADERIKIWYIDKYKGILLSFKK